MDALIAVLLLAASILILIIGYILGRRLGLSEARRELPRLLQEAREDATKRSKSVLQGQFSEQIAPYMPDFPYSPTEVRFLGKPVDFVVFKGMDNHDIEEVVFVEVKTGKSQLNTQERKLKEVVKNKKVSWDEYRVTQQ